MPINPYFNFTTQASEQNLIDALIVESIQIYGHNAYYLRRDVVNLDRLLGEDPLQEFKKTYAIEIYLKSSEAFLGQSEFISKFGLHIEDQATFVVSVTRFNQVVIGELDRPREGDIIYIEFTPTNRYLFEIRFVEDKEQLFQLGKLYTYELRCEMMNYSQERIETNITAIDGVAAEDAYTIELALGAGTGNYQDRELVYQGTSLLEALASATVTNWNANTKTLQVQQIAGEFVSPYPILGISSNASYIIASTPSTFPSVKDPLADNERLETEAETVIVNRGTNPTLD